MKTRKDVKPNRKVIAIQYFWEESTTHWPWFSNLILHPVIF